MASWGPAASLASSAKNAVAAASRSSSDWPGQKRSTLGRVGAAGAVTMGSSMLAGVGSASGVGSATGSGLASDGSIEALLAPGSP